MGGEQPDALYRRRYLALTTAAVAGLAGCSSSDEPEPADTDDSSTDDGSSPTDGSDSPTDGGGSTDDGGSDGGDGQPAEVSAVVGELVDGEQMHLVVEGVERGVDLGEFTEPAAGNEFLAVDVALKNVSDDYVTVSNLLQTRVRDDEDYQYDMTIVGGGLTFNDGQFAPGEVERGRIPFEIPTDASGLELVFDFDVSIFGGIQRAVVDLESEAAEIRELSQSLAVDVYGLGDTVEYADVEIAVDDVRTESSLGAFAEPEEGNEFVIVDIAITNGTGESKQFSTALQMMVKDGAGYTYQEDLTATSQLDRAFDEGTPLADGETRRGELAYQVEEGESPLYWVFEFELFESGDKTFWQLR